MSETEARTWEAAERAADYAPELTPGDAVHMRLQQLLGGCLAQSASAREDREDRDAA